MIKILRKDYIFGPLLAFLFVSLGFAVLYPAFKVGAESQLNTLCKTSSATTSPAYLTTGGDVYGASATTTCETAVTDLSDITIHLVSSSTATKLHWKYEFNNSPSGSNELWGGEDLAQVASANSVTHSSTTIDHTWQTARSTDVKNIQIDPISSKQMRVIFSVTGANAAVWFEAAQKSDFSR